MWIQLKFPTAESNTGRHRSLVARLNCFKIGDRTFITNLCKVTLALVVPIALRYVTTQPTLAATLWYTGDPDGQGSTRNSFNIYPPFPVFGGRLTQLVLDDFVIPTTDEAWNINEVWSNNLLQAPNRVSGVFWSIEQLVPRNIPGERPFRREIIAEGVSSAILIPTNFTVSGSDYSVYTVKASGLNVTLSPGTYWLSVTPQYISNSPTDAPVSRIATTSGSNAIGIPPGDNGNSFILDYIGGFEPGNPQNIDYSMGLEGTVVPEPTSILGVLTFGAFGLGFRRWRKQKFTRDSNNSTTR